MNLVTALAIAIGLLSVLLAWLFLGPVVGGWDFRFGLHLLPGPVSSTRAAAKPAEKSLCGRDLGAAMARRVGRVAASVR